MATKILCAVDDSEHATVAIQAATTIAKAMGALSREMVMNLQSFETACVYGGLPSRAIAYRRRADRMTSIEVSDHLRLIAGRLPRRSNAKSHVGGLNGRALLACCIPRVGRWVVVRTFTARICQRAAWRDRRGARSSVSIKFAVSNWPERRVALSGRADCHFAVCRFRRGGVGPHHQIQTKALAKVSVQ